MTKDTLRAVAIIVAVFLVILFNSLYPAFEDKEVDEKTSEPISDINYPDSIQVSRIYNQTKTLGLYYFEFSPTQTDKIFTFPLPKSHNRFINLYYKKGIKEGEKANISTISFVYPSYGVDDVGRCVFSSEKDWTPSIIKASSVGCNLSVVEDMLDEAIQELRENLKYSRNHTTS